jgi:hypothetical protein
MRDGKRAAAAIDAYLASELTQSRPDAALVQA